MMDTSRSLPQTATSDIGEAQQRVLRNTYALLALSMVPTVLGAFIGIQLNFSFMAGSPFIGALLFIGISIGFFWAIERTKNSGLGVLLLLGYTFFMGLMLTRILQTALGFSNGGTMIAMAGAGTGAIFVTMASIAATTKRNFSSIGKFLFGGLVVLILAMFANIYFQIPALSLALSAMAVAIFSGYVMYDINRIVHGGEDNYISATLAVYLDIYNIFANLLHLIMAFSGERD